MTPNPNEDRDSGDKGKEPISPANVTEVVQFSRSMLFTALKFLTRDDNQRGAPPVSDEKLVEPDYVPAPALTTLLNALEPEHGSSIVVFGAGSVGFSAIMAADAAGCSDIIAVDIKESRLDKAGSLGATKTFNPNEVVLFR